MDLLTTKTDPMLTRVSVEFRNAQFVAEKIFPPILVDLQSDKYFAGGRDSLRPQDDSRRPNSFANEIDWQLSKENYDCDGHALRFPIPDAWRANVRPGQTFDWDIDATTQLTQKMQLNQDIALYDLISSALSAASQAGSQWDDDDVDPEPIIDAAKESTAMKVGHIPNVMAIGRRAFRVLKNNYNIKSRITGASQLQNATVTAEQLAAFLELDELIVVDTVKNTAKEGQPDSMSWVWGDTALLFYRPANPGLRTISLGYTFTWKTGMRGTGVKRYREEGQERDVVELQKYYDQKIVVQDAGVFFTDILTPPQP